ncbi:MAG: SDR family NAD(P)-dependent oxidoreductase [Cyanobacteria bacterium CRU_2_1]|nr:SDR family NAD(P)-dependent oxidoreductase [Cyanobacteria bacterium CRU_2_1]
MVVTGAGSGIGKAIAERLAEEDGRVICVDLKGETTIATADGIQQAGSSAKLQNKYRTDDLYLHDRLHLDSNRWAIG